MSTKITGEILETNRKGLREWFILNYNKKTHCWVKCKRGSPKEGILCYLDAVEEALCFGWIDSTVVKVDGATYNRFSPRVKKSHWTELNKERVRRLERLGLMTDAGRAVLPDMDSGPKMDSNIDDWFVKNPEMKKRFMSYPELYRRIQLSNLQFYKENFPDAYNSKLKNFRQRIIDGRMINGWNDYGRLIQ